MNVPTRITAIPGTMTLCPPVILHEQTMATASRTSANDTTGNPVFDNSAGIARFEEMMKSQ